MSDSPEKNSALALDEAARVETAVPPQKPVLLGRPVAVAPIDPNHPLQRVAAADVAYLNVLLARQRLAEAAAALEEAQQGFQSLCAEAGSFGLSSHRLKRMVQERVDALVSAGVVQAPKNAPARAKKTPSKPMRTAQPDRATRPSEPHPEESLGEQPLSDAPS